MIAPTLVNLLSLIALATALPNDHLNYLGIRQDVPIECAAQCDPINAIIASQCTVSKCCTPAFANGYVDCVTCFGGSIQLTNYVPFQTAFDSLFAACSRAAQPIPKLTLPGQDPNRVIASTSATITRSSTASLPASSEPASSAGTPTTSIASSVSQVVASSTSISLPLSTPTSPLSPLPPPAISSTPLSAVSSGAASGLPTTATNTATSNRIAYDVIHWLANTVFVIACMTYFM